MSADTATALVLDWPAAADAGPSVAGGKGWNLGWLDRYGLTAPPGVVLAAAAYQSFMAANDLWTEAAALEAALPDVSDEGAAQRLAAQRLAALRGGIEAGALPGEVRAALEIILQRADIAGAALAVRSSATAEDAAGASFAGIHH